MLRRRLVSLTLPVVIGVASATLDLAGQSQTPSTPTTARQTPKSERLLRTPWGDPDIQGIFTTDDELGVPFERPEQFAGRALVTDEEFAQRATQAERLEEADREEFVVPRTGGGPGKAVASYLGDHRSGRWTNPVLERRSTAAKCFRRQRANIGTPTVRWSRSHGPVRSLHHTGLSTCHLSDDLQQHLADRPGSGVRRDSL
jgi:hypothetical protein